MATNFMPDVKQKAVPQNLKDKAAAAAVKPAVKTDGWLTRHEITDLRGVTQKTISDWEDRKLLTPQRVTRPDRDGRMRLIYVYDPREVARLPRRPTNVRDPGELTARCFELLERGKTQREIVIELRITTEEALKLRDQWTDSGGADFVITQEAKVLLQEYVGEFSTVAELVMRVKAKVAA